MEFWIFFWIYTFSLIVIWSFFIIAKIHSLKFYNYQPSILIVTKVVLVVLSIVSALWYILIFTSTWNYNSFSIEDQNPQSNIQRESDDIFNISDNMTIPSHIKENYY